MDQIISIRKDRKILSKTAFSNIRHGLLIELSSEDTYKGYKDTVKDRHKIEM